MEHAKQTLNKSVSSTDVKTLDKNNKKSLKSGEKKRLET